MGGCTSACTLFIVLLSITVHALQGGYHHQRREVESCPAVPADWPYVCAETDSRTKCISNSPNPLEPMPVNLTLAFYGDQGVDAPPYTSGKRVDLMKQLVDEDGVEAFFHAGDFDYTSTPTRWDDQINAVLGPLFPYFSSIGNHDFDSWATSDSPASAYNEKIFNRYSQMGAKCWGDVGRDAVCSYKGFTFVTSGVGTDSTWNEPFIEKAFENFGGIWRMCMWHKNQRILQVGSKSDEVGFEAYNRCAKMGAIIVTGHEHSYCRSKPISSYQEPRPTFQDVSSDDFLVTKPGLSWLTVVGTGGMPVRPCLYGLEQNPWWAAYACYPDFDDAAALVCKFNLNGNPRLAYCYFKTRTRQILDQFFVYSNNTVQYHCQQTPSPQPPVNPPVPVPVEPPVPPTPVQPPVQLEPAPTEELEPSPVPGNYTAEIGVSHAFSISTIIVLIVFALIMVAFILILIRYRLTKQPVMVEFVPLEEDEPDDLK